MDFTGLKWTKNVNPQGKKDWAYKDKSDFIEPQLNIFALTWENQQ